MAKAKKPGKDRPWTWGEFSSYMIEEFLKKAKENKDDEFYSIVNQLDYFNGERYSWMGNQDILDAPYIVSMTREGGNEGIYSDFFVGSPIGQKDVQYFAVAKTLYEDTHAFVNMHRFAGLFTAIVNSYASEHPDEFKWSGWSIYWLKDGEKSVCSYYTSKENALDELMGWAFKQSSEVILRDNRTHTERKFEVDGWKKYVKTKKIA